MVTSQRATRMVFIIHVQPDTASALTHASNCLQEPEVLSLLEFSNTEPVRDGALQLIFPSALSPHVAVDVSGSQPRVYAVTARGFLHAISLPGLQEHGQQQGDRHRSILARVPSDGSAFAGADLSQGEHSAQTT